MPRRIKTWGAGRSCGYLCTLSRRALSPYRLCDVEMTAVCMYSGIDSSHSSARDFSFPFFASFAPRGGLTLLAGLRGLSSCSILRRAVAGCRRHFETGVPSLDVGWDGDQLHECMGMYYTTGRKWQHHCVSVCSTLHIGYIITINFSYRTWGNGFRITHVASTTRCTSSLMGPCYLPITSSPPGLRRYIVISSRRGVQRVGN